MSSCFGPLKIKSWFRSGEDKRRMSIPYHFLDVLNSDSPNIRLLLKDWCGFDTCSHVGKILETTWEVALEKDSLKIGTARN